MTTFNPKRRALFSRFAPPIEQENKGALRPPFAQSEVSFLSLCNQCNDCIKACPMNIIKLEHDYPTLTDKNRCDDCLACVKSCKSGALQKSNLIIKIGSQCSPKMAIYCQSCLEVCPNKALIIEQGKQPAIDIERCNGCGECINECEFNAIRLVAR
ncbi:4Fe-4S binding protein [Vibrio sp. SS-MA-C1-2]|uniref:4Fe-4S binding protein n=1 Tax=Vibrio sp. SS-MA-C1-2 TaxID=2908646 RepID=UPI001F275E8A|nr:4Fe-4S binding protein [Vibrio sp. SS-MA-C1-2]UJF18420.1 4Fe-4S binding protein [Vibrio sp. SS-MA-C1-2]